MAAAGSNTIMNAKLATFGRAKKWVQEFQVQGSANTIVALAGNKADLLEARQASAQEAQTYAQDNGLQLQLKQQKMLTICSMKSERLIEAKPVEDPQGMILDGRPGDRPAARSSGCST